MNRQLFLLVLLCTVLSAHAQTYSLEVLKAPYVDLQETISINNGATWDDPEDEIEIGFDLLFFNESFNSMTLASVGSGLIVGDFDYYTNYYDTLAVLLPYECDLIDRGFIDGSSISDISYTVEGAPGERTFYMQWQNVGFYTELTSDSISSDYINFQLSIRESDGVIRVHIGPNSVLNPDQSYDNGSGANIALIEGFLLDEYSTHGGVISLVGPPQNPNTQDSFVPYYGARLEGTPLENTVYQFSPIATSVAELNGNSFLSISPNPVQDQLRISLSASGQDQMTYQLFDLSGRLMAVGNVYNNQINLSSVRAGTYELQLTTENDSYSTKLIKQ